MKTVSSVSKNNLTLICSHFGRLTLPSLFSTMESSILSFNETTLNFKRLDLIKSELCFEDNNVKGPESSTIG